MKRCERMSKEEIIGVLITQDRSCYDCALYDREKRRCKYYNTQSCEEAIVKWLMSDVDVKPRFKTLDSCEELIRLIDAFYNDFTRDVNFESDCAFIVEMFKNDIVKKLTEEVEVTE